MTVSGDYVVEKGTRVEIANGAVITVEGNRRSRARSEAMRRALYHCEM
jgi:hypothetical protein